MAASEGCRVIAVDGPWRSSGALVSPSARATECARRLATMPLAADSIDLVLADGSFTPLDVSVDTEMCRAAAWFAPRLVHLPLLHPGRRARRPTTCSRICRSDASSFHVLRFRLALAPSRPAGSRSDACTTRCARPARPRRSGRPVRLARRAGTPDRQLPRSRGALQLSDARECVELREEPSKPRAQPRRTTARRRFPTLVLERR
jgi:hypothetical protein